jgi:DNA-binding PadR family transcriptional regulator
LTVLVVEYTNLTMSARLVVLGMLSKKPLHGYEMQRFLEQSQTAQWARVLPGSIYHALKAMTGEGLVEVLATESSGHRQRAIYAITDAGREAYRGLLREAWKRLPDSLPSDLFVTLTFWEDLPRAEILEALDAMLEKLRAQREGWDRGELAKAQAMPLPDWMRALFQNGRDHYDADLRLLSSLRDAAARPRAKAPKR